MIANLAFEEFAQILDAYLRPGPPILSEEQHFQHDTQVHEIEQALRTPGRTVFIYGNLGAGNTSLAQIVAAHENKKTTLILKAEDEREDDFVVLIDQFDQITGNVERRRFAEFLGEIEDARMPIRFIFCGVSESLRKMLEPHESGYLENMELPCPSGDARFEVGGRHAEDPHTTVPHYVHLVSEELFWDMLNDPTFARSLR